jgi:hypothetical protein
MDWPEGSSTYPSTDALPASDCPHAGDIATNPAMQAKTKILILTIIHPYCYVGIRRPQAVHAVKNSDEITWLSIRPNATRNKLYGGTGGFCAIPTNASST